VAYKNQMLVSDDDHSPSPLKVKRVKLHRGAEASSSSVLR